MMLKRISLAFGIYLAAATVTFATDFPVIPPQATNSFGRDRNTFFIVPSGAPSGRLVAKTITPQALIFLAATTTIAEKAALGIAPGDISGFNATASAAAPVQSVAGYTGAVIISVEDLSDISDFIDTVNLWIDDATSDLATSAALTTTNANVTANATAISGLTTTVSGKQNILTAGTNITITGSTISAANAPVTSVAGRTGAVTIANTDVSGLGTASTHATGDYAAASHTHTESNITGLVSDLAGKQAGPLTGDVTTSGAAATIGASKVTNTMLAGSIADSKISSASTWNAKQDQVIAGTGITLNGDNKTISVTHPAGYWRDSTQKTNSIQVSGSVLTSGATATFNVTTDGTSGGTAICTSITAQDTNFTTWGTNQLYNYTTPVITNNKVVAVDVKYLSSSNLVTGAPVYSNVGNGTRINMKLMCD